MKKYVVSLIFISMLVFGVAAVAVEPQTGSVSADNDPTSFSNRLKEKFSKNEQKPKVMRSKDIVKNKNKIREQEMLRLQKEREIKFLNRRIDDKQKVLNRLENSKGE